MKVLGSAAFAAAMFVAGSAQASDWLQGVYLNGDKGSSMDEVIFCDAGKAYAGMGHRTYSIEEKDGKKVVTLSSNGNFHFTITDNGNKLLPADKFTKDWFTQTALTKDPKRKDTCNW